MLNRPYQNRMVRNLACAVLAISAVGGITVATTSSAQAAPTAPNYPTEVYCYDAGNKFARLHVWFDTRENYVPSGQSSGAVIYNTRTEYNQKIRGSRARRWNAEGPTSSHWVAYRNTHFSAQDLCNTTGYKGGVGLVKW